MVLIYERFQKCVHHRARNNVSFQKRSPADQSNWTLISTDTRVKGLVIWNDIEHYSVGLQFRYRTGGRFSTLPTISNSGNIQANYHKPPNARTVSLNYQMDKSVVILINHVKDNVLYFLRRRGHQICKFEYKSATGLVTDHSSQLVFTLRVA